MSGQGRGSSRDDIALSVSETNKLRISLGLAPLEEESGENRDKKPVDIETPKAVDEPKPDVEDIQKKIDRLRARHIGAGKESLGQMLEKQDAGLLSWLESSKASMKGTKKTGRHRAENIDRRVDAGASGLKVGHSMESIDAGRDTILVLKDSGILEIGGERIVQGDDVLENVEMSKQQKLKKAIEKSKKKSALQVYEEQLSTGVKKVLPQYDEDSDDESFVIGSGRKMLDTVDLIGVKGADSDRRRLVSLASSAMVTTKDFVENAPAPKRRRRRKKAANRPAVLPAGLSDDEGGDSDHISRAGAAARRENNLNNEQKTQTKSFSKALQRARESSRASQKLANPEEEDGGGDPFQTRTRLAISDSRRGGGASGEIFSLFKRMREDRQSSVVEPSAAGSEEIVFNEAVEFSRTVGSRVHVIKDEVVKERKPAEMHVSPKREVSEAAPAAEKPIHEETEKAPEEVEQEELEREPVVGSGLGGALSLLREKGELEAERAVAGRSIERRAAKREQVIEAKSNAPPTVKIEHLDEFGRPLGPKEAFRRMSYKFHGTVPGKKKQEKRIKEFAEDLRQRMSSVTDTPLGSMQAFKGATSKTGLPYVVLSGSQARKDVRALQITETEKKEKRRAAAEARRDKRRKRKE